MTPRGSRAPVVIVSIVVFLVVGAIISGIVAMTMRSTNDQVDRLVAPLLAEIDAAEAEAGIPPSRDGAAVPPVIDVSEALEALEALDGVDGIDASEALEALEALPAGDGSGSPTVGSTSIDLFTGDRIVEVVDEIRVARGADTLRVLSVVVYEGYAVAQVQNPAAPDEIDQYQWRGTAGTPTPVRLHGDGDLEENLFDHDAVDWSAIPALVASAPELVGIADGEVTHVYVERGLPFTTDVQIRVFVTSARSSGFVTADAGGDVVAVVTG